MNLLTEFQEQIGKQALFTAKHKLLLALSGGLDSMVLLTLLHRCKYTFEVAHVNYQLRGAESDADATFVRDYCLLHQIPFHETKFDTQLFAKAAALGIQEAARNLRYQWFQQLIDQLGFDYLLTAHHANDQAETILFHLLRGAGAKGLSGMQVIKNKTIRPLLFVTKQQLIDFAAELNIPFRQDSSNEKDTYSRNFIRQHIIPKALQVQPNFVEGIQHYSTLMLHTWHYYNERIQQIKRDLVSVSDGQTIISIPKLLQMPFMDMVLFEIIQEYGFNHNQCQQVISACQANSTGAIFISPSYRLLLDRDHLIIGSDRPKIEPQEIAQLPCEITIGNNHISFMSCAFDGFTPNTWWLDLDALNLPLTLRGIESGDRFMPLGLTHFQKVSDYFINHKINRFKKDLSWALITEGEICFLALHQISNQYKIKAETKNFLKIRLIK
ncbi:MAG: tRNA lysidine(34) synthetase TilS [bacterium]|nr:tRNA lysidine(34) synthetase TilS [bacterium]